MACQLIWSPAARLDLRGIYDYIAQGNRPAAAKFVQGLIGDVEQVQIFPESGRVVPEFGDSTIREIFRKPCRVVYRYRVSAKVVEIVRIWHAARGAPQL